MSATRHPGAASLVVCCTLGLIPRGACGQLGLAWTTSAALLVHQVDIGYGVEQTSGLVLGAEGALAVRSRWRFAVHAAGGSLSGPVTDAEQRDVGELGVRGSVVATPWLAIVSGATSRTYSSAIARQRWTIVDLGAEARVDFATTPVRGVLRGGLLPVVSVRGLPGPDVGLTAAAGVEYRSGAVSGGLFYGLERYDFPDTGAGRRLEQVNTLSLRVTVRRGSSRTSPDR